MPADSLHLHSCALLDGVSDRARARARCVQHAHNGLDVMNDVARGGKIPMLAAHLLSRASSWRAGKTAASWRNRDGYVTAYVPAEMAPRRRNMRVPSENSAFGGGYAQ